MVAVAVAVTAGLVGAAVVVVVVAALIAHGVLTREMRDEQLRLRASETSARRAEAVLARGLDAIPHGVVLYNANGEPLLRNRAAAAFLDVHEGGLDIDGLEELLMPPAFAGESASHTVDVAEPTRRTYMVTARPLRPPGPTSSPVEGVALLIDDISERTRVDDLRRDFVANISHELKTPVGAIGLLAETLVAEHAAGGLADAASSAVVERLADRMHHEALRIGRTIDDLLELSMIEGGEPSTHELVSAEQLLADAVDRMTPAADLRAVTLSATCDPTHLEVRGDRRQLVSALVNLVDNAVKYSDAGSSVELAAHEVDGLVELSVVDHGIGIPQPHLDRVFERFYRVDEARSRATGGTGLGLAIVRHVMSNHRGDVQVASSEGEGSRFTLRVPGPAASARDQMRSTHEP